MTLSVILNIEQPIQTECFAPICTTLVSLYYTLYYTMYYTLYYTLLGKDQPFFLDHKGLNILFQTQTSGEGAVAASQLK